MYAPAAHPSRATATAKPVTASLSANSSFMASTAPLTTEESKPKRKPPTAPASASQMTLFGILAVMCSWAVDMDLPWLLGGGFCGADVVGCGTGQRAGAHAPNSVARHRLLFHFGTRND